MNWYKISQQVSDIVMLDFPQTKQASGFTCGPASLESVFSYYGLDINECRLVDELNTTFENGTEYDDIAKLAKEVGLKADVRRMQISDLLNYLNNKIPVIVWAQAWATGKGEKKDLDYSNYYKSGHYMVAIGYNNQGLYFQDPWLTHRGFLTFQEMTERWHGLDKNKKKQHNIGIAIYGIEPKYTSKRVVPIR